MAQQQSITLDTAFSGAPLVPQEEEQEQVTPVSVPQQAPVADSVDTQVNQAMPAPTPPQPVVEAPVDFDEFTGFQESIEKPRPLPILFGTYAERRNTVTATDDAGRKAELKRIQQDVFDQYRRGVLTTGEKTRDSERENLITNSKYVGIPQLDENGGIVNDANGVPVLIERYALPAYGIEDEQQKFMGNTIGMFELANQPNGVYLFYADESNIPTNGISLKAEIDKARTQVQEYAVERGFARTETMEGGMSFYDDILKKRGVTRPEKRLYYLRNQAASTSIFTGAEMTRTGVMFKDMVPGLFNFGMMLGETAQDHALSIPMTMMSMLMPDDVKKQAGIEDSFSFFNAPGFGFGAKGAGVDAMIEAQKKIIRGGRTLPMFTLTAEQWAKENGVSVSEAEAVMGYTSDIATAIARFTLETLVTAPTVLKGVRHLDNRTYREFSDYVLTNYKTMLDDAVEETTVVKDIGRKEAQEQGAWKGTNATPAETADLVTIQKVLDDANISFTDAFEEFAESRLFGSRAWLEGSIERALQTRTVEMGAERVVLYGDRVEKVLQPKINSLNERIAQAKVDIRKAPDKATRDTAKQKIARLKGQRKGLLAEKRELEADILVPSHVKNFLVDDLAIATPIAGATYATLYAATEGNELAPGIGAMVSVVASLNPTVRRGFSYTGQSIKYAAHSALKKAGIAKTAPPDAKAVELARRIKGANPELRDRIYAFMEDVSAAVDKYGSITYPKGHPMAGKPILTEDVLYQSFSMMSGLSSLRALQEQTFNRTADIKEIGKFKQEMETLQNDFDERARMVDQLGQVVQNLKYLESSVDFDTASDAANIVRTMRGFYEIEFQQLTRDQADFNASLAGDAEIEKIFSADATALDVQEWLGGGKSIAVALATEMRRFQKYGIDPNLSPVEAEQALQAHLNTIQTNVAEALKRHEKIEFSGSRKLATQDFNNFITVQEEIAYVEASNKFDKLKTMFPPTARVDLTDIHDQIVLGELELDLDIVDAIVPALREGTEASRSFVPGLNIDKNVQYALRRLFGDSAEEYMDAVGELRLKDPDADALIGEILEKYDLQDKSPYAQMMGIRQGFLDADIEDALPRLGVSVDQLVHIVSGLGRRVSKKDPQAARSLNQLRMGILDRSRDEFYEDFYTGRQQKVEGLGDEYQAAREFYRTRYIDPFRNEDTSIRQIVKMSEGKRDLDDKSLDKFLANFQLNERRSTAALNQMQQQL
ncbi:MAG: hypothetical protein ACPHEP_11335, partial [Acidimicrobiales bacterium]